MIARVEDAFWETGKCSGTMYGGDHEHYDFLNRAFTLFSHVNALRRDMCPSQTRFEGEIMAVTFDMLHGDANTSTRPVGLVTNDGTGSILHAVLAYRETGRRRGVTRPNLVKCETAHPALEKACHLFGVECRNALVDSSDGRFVRLPKPRSGAASPSMPDRCLVGRHSPAIGDPC